MQQILVLNYGSVNFPGQLEELNACLKDGWKVVSQTAGGNVFSYVLEYNKENNTDGKQ